MKEFNPEYLQHLRKIIEDHADSAAREELSDLHPADIAELYRDLDLEEAEYLFRLLDEETQADVLMELDEDERAKLLSKMDAEDIAKQIEHLDTDDAVDIIQELDEDERDKILSHIDDVEQAGDTFVNTIRRTWDYIMHEWIPQSAYEYLGDCDFKTYRECSREFSEQIFIHIRKRKEG